MSFLIFENTKSANMMALLKSCDAVNFINISQAPFGSKVFCAAFL